MKCNFTDCMFYYAGTGTCTNTGYASCPYYRLKATAHDLMMKCRLGWLNGDCSQCSVEGCISRKEGGLQRMTVDTYVASKEDTEK